MSFEFLISAFILGFTGSFHCVGMCGPIALAAPVQNTNPATKWWSFGLYLFGKALTYAGLGLLFGAFGRQMEIAGFQQQLSVVLGSFLLIIVATLFLNPKGYHTNVLQQFLSNKLIPLFGKILNRQSNSTPFLLGLLNGLLPCGLVYIGLLGATATGTFYGGAAFMFLFGLGTMPVMFLFLTLSHQFSYTFRDKMKKATPIFISIIGVLLILRGLDVNIPFISPMLNTMTDRSAEAMSCIPK